MATLTNKLKVLSLAVEKAAEYSDDLVEWIQEDLIPQAEEQEKKLTGK